VKLFLFYIIFIGCTFAFAKDKPLVIDDDLSYSDYVSSLPENTIKTDISLNYQSNFLHALETDSDITKLKTRLISSLKQRGVNVPNISISPYHSSLGGHPISIKSYKEVLASSLAEIEKIPQQKVKGTTQSLNFVSGYDFSFDVDLQIPLPTPEGFWYGLLTAEGIHHPRFKEFLERRRYKTLERYFSLSKNMSAEDKLKIKYIVNNFCGHEISLFRNTSEIKNHPFFESSKIKIEQGYAKSVTLNIQNNEFTIYYDKNARGRRKLVLYKKGVEHTSSSSHFAIAKIELDNNCLIQNGEITNFTNGSKHSKLNVDSSGNSFRHFYFNPDITPPIRENCHQGTKINLDQILETGFEVNKVLIALLDTGVDYNDPELSKHLARVPKYVSKTEQSALDLIARMQEELNKLKSKSWFEKVTMNLSGYDQDERITDIRNLIMQNQKNLDRAKEIRQSGLTFVGKDFNDNDDKPYDYFEGTIFEPYFRQHGTSMLKILSKSEEDVYVLNVKYPQYGQMGNQKFIEAIDYSISFGANIVNMSFGIDANFGHAIEKSIKKHTDTLFVSAAGNADRQHNSLRERNLESNPIYPAVYQHNNHITVTNLNADSRSISDISFYSNKLVEIGVYSPKSSSGSAAEISRIAGRIKKICPHYDGPSIKKLLIQTSDKVEKLMPYIKNGSVVNEERAIIVASQNCK